MFKFIKKLLGVDSSTHRDVETDKPKKPKLAPTVNLTDTSKKPKKPKKPAAQKAGKWSIPNLGGINIQMVLKQGTEERARLTYVTETSRLELNIGGKVTPANITTRIQTTINNRLRKAGEIEIPIELFNKWEEDIIEAEGDTNNTYASRRIKKITSAKKKSRKKRIPSI